MVTVLVVAVAIPSIRLATAPRDVVNFRGASIRVHQVSYGTKHTFVPGPVWHRMLAIMPTNVTQALKIDTRVEQTKEPTLMIWFEWKGKVNSPLPPFLQVGDSHGLLSNVYFMGRSVRVTNHFFYAFVVDNFPRHEEEIVAELFWVPAKQHERAAQFHIRNPAYRKASKASKPDSKIQLTADVAGEKFTLVALNTGLSATGQLAQLSFNNQWTELAVRVGTNEPAQRGLSIPPLNPGPWEIGSIELSDRYGNIVSERDPCGRISPLDDHFRSRRDDGIAFVRGAIWPSGNWKVRVTFDRLVPFTDQGNRWTTSIPVPRGAGTISLSETGRIKTAQVYLHSIENLGASNWCSLNFQLLPSRDGIQVVQVRDQRGVNLAYQDRTPQPNVIFQAQPESRTVKLTFALTHLVTVEFSSPVTILRTNVAHWAPTTPPATPVTNPL
jgi:hypothetical protein